MASVASPPRPVGAAPPPVRHGICRLTLRIGGTEYRLRPMPAPPGFRKVWTLRKLGEFATAHLFRRPAQGRAGRLHLPGSRTAWFHM